MKKVSSISDFFFFFWKFAKVFSSHCMKIYSESTCYQNLFGILSEFFKKLRKYFLHQKIRLILSLKKLVNKNSIHIGLLRRWYIYIYFHKSKSLKSTMFQQTFVKYYSLNFVIFFLAKLSSVKLKPENGPPKEIVQFFMNRKFYNSTNGKVS